MSGFFKNVTNAVSNVLFGQIVEETDDDDDDEKLIDTSKPKPKPKPNTNLNKDNKYIVKDDDVVSNEKKMSVIETDEIDNVNIIDNYKIENDEKNNISIDDCNDEGIDGEIVSTTYGSIAKFNESKDEFDIISDSARLVISTSINEDYTYFLTITSKKPEFFHAQIIGNDMQIAYRNKSNLFEWIFPTDPIKTFIFAYQDRKQEMEVIKTKRWISKALVESSRQEIFEKAIKKQQDRQWIYDRLDEDLDLSSSASEYEEKAEDMYTFEDEKSMDIDLDNLSDDEPIVEPDRRRSKIPNSFTPRVKKSKDRIRNTSAAVGMADQKTFVVRGNKIGIFKHDDKRDAFMFDGEIDTKETGEEFTPGHIQLHQRDTNMFLLDQNNPNVLYGMDLNRPDKVMSFKGGEGHKFRGIAPIEKYAQLTNEQMIFGTNKNQVYKIDPRVAKNQVVDKKTWSYRGLNAICTTSGGKIAVASDTGELRFYSDHSKRAKTTLPGLGDPIIHLESTSNGEWVLCTTTKYLVVICMKSATQGKTGFDKSIRKEDPKLFKLKLSLKDRKKYKLKQLNFSKAHFNSGPNNESWIITSTGPYLVTWNFNKVKKGILDKYEIKNMGENITDNTFRFNKLNEIVVTLDNDVFTQKRSVKK